MFFIVSIDQNKKRKNYWNENFKNFTPLILSILNGIVIPIVIHLSPSEVSLRALIIEITYGILLI